MKKVLVYLFCLITTFAFSITVARGSQTPGIDVSSDQGTISWTNVFAAGYRFAFVRATEGDDRLPQIIDGNFQTNMVNGRAAGILVGAYHVGYPTTNNAVREANFFVSVASNYITTGYMRPALDIEQAEVTNMIAQGRTQELWTWIATWMETVKTNTGVGPVLYVSSSTTTTPGIDPALTNYPLWVAAYHDPSIPPVTGVWPSWNFWQYSASAVVTGVPGNKDGYTDIDFFNSTLTDLTNGFVIESLPAPATDFTYTTNTNNGTITITGYIGSGGAVNIPSTINGYPVTSIGGWAFSSCTKLTSVMIPNNVTNIGNEAFYNCNSLTSGTIPNSVSSIGDNAFDTCTSLTNVTIGTNVTSIGDYAFAYTSLTSVTIPGSVTSIGLLPFYGCGSLSAITVDAENSVYSSVDGVLVNKSQTTLIEYPGGKAGSYTIPNSVTSIGDYAFYLCSLTNVMVGNSVTSIGVYAFYSCNSLTNVTIGNSVTNIEDYAFWGCANLTGVYFKGNAPGSIGSGVFNNGSGGYDPATVYYLPGTTGWNSPTFGGLLTALWKPQVQTANDSFGVQTNQFGFNITWASGMVVVVEACTNFSNPVWQPVQTNTLTGGSSYFSDPQWTNYPGRFYRLRSP